MQNQTQAGNGIAWRIARTHGPRAAATAIAIRGCQQRALDIAAEADMDGRPGIARALRRKVARPRMSDVEVIHMRDRVRVRISAYGVVAESDRRTRVPV